jgi:hypothetical protein
MRLAWLAVLAALAGCQLIGGIDDIVLLRDGAAPGSDAPADTGAPDSSNADADASLPCGAGASCIPVPPGWSGPVEFYVGSSPQPSCPAGTTLALQGGSGIDAPNATCSTCTCGAATGVTCRVTVDLYTSTDTTCSGSLCATRALLGGCNTVVGNCATGVPRWTADVTPRNGSCAASVQAPTLPPISWSSYGVACAFAADGGTPVAACGTTGICAPYPAASFSLCIYQAGTQSCPPGYVNPAQTFDTKVVDTRSCTDCNCALTPTCTGGDVTLASTPNCGGGASTPLPAACTSTGLSGSVFAEVSSAPTPGGSCAASGGAPSGSATGSSPVTMCCL